MLPILLLLTSLVSGEQVEKTRDDEMQVQACEAVNGVLLMGSVEKIIDWNGIKPRVTPVSGSTLLTTVRQAGALFAGYHSITCPPHKGLALVVMLSTFPSSFLSQLILLMATIKRDLVSILALLAATSRQCRKRQSERQPSLTASLSDSESSNKWTATHTDCLMINWS